MRNIIHQKPTDALTPRQKFSERFVRDKDLNGRKVLDIGCGFGWFELYALEKGAKEVNGIEISEKDLETARKEIKNKRAIFKIGGALKLPFEDNYFDTVVAWEVIEHIPQDTERKMFSEVKRVLKIGGKFYLSTPNDSFLSKTFDPAWWLIGHRHYSREFLLKIGKKYNFKIEEEYIKGRLWNLVNVLNLYVSKWVFRRRPFFEESLMRKEDVEFRKMGFMGIYIKYKHEI